MNTCYTEVSLTEGYDIQKYQQKDIQGIKPLLGMNIGARNHNRREERCAI